MQEKAEPSMSQWEEAWLEANHALLQSLYAEDGMVFAPNQPCLKGGPAILAFFGAGVGQVEVRFFPTERLIGETLAFESSIVRDFERGPGTVQGKVVESCHYAITWCLEQAQWKIKLHTWTVPFEESP